ncbi:unnamed protein product [Discula destructiva]
MPAQEPKTSQTTEAEPSARRRSGRISSSRTKSQYFEAYSNDDDDDELIGSPYKRASTGSLGKKRSRPHKTPAPTSTSRRKKAKIESDDGNGDDYADENSDARFGEEEADEDEDDEDAPPRVTITPLIKLRETGGVPYQDDRLHKNTLLFLKDLKANNQRTWLKSHDKEFRRAQADWSTYVETLTPKIIAADPTIPELPVKDVVMRIYRDIRFSNDPTPYRPFFAAAFSRTGRKGPYACYYIHCEPNSSFLGGGLYMPDAAALARIRASIDRHPERWRTALGNDGLRKAFLGGVKQGDVEGCVRAFCMSNRENALKTKPKGFQSDHRDIELLKLRNFTIARKALPETMFTGADGQEQIAVLVRAMVGFVTFLNNVVMPDHNADSEHGSSDEEEDGDGNEVEDDA